MVLNLLRQCLCSLQCSQIGFSQLPAVQPKRMRFCQILSNESGPEEIKLSSVSHFKKQYCHIQNISFLSFLSSCDPSDFSNDPIGGSAPCLVELLLKYLVIKGVFW